MKVVGISPLDKDATVSIVEDDTVLYAAGEERFSRVKLQDGFPTTSLERGLEYSGIELRDIDAVCYPFFDSDKETALFIRNIADEQAFMADFDSQTDLQSLIRVAQDSVPQRDYLIPGLGQPNEKMDKGVLKTLFYRLSGGDSVLSRNIARGASRRWSEGASKYHRKWQDELEASLLSLGLKSKLKRLDHHLSHASNAYFGSGFEDALIVTLDGYGSGLAGSISSGKGGIIKRLCGIEYPHSLGTFYESVTSALGFRPSRHEGKIVGLAAYGNPAVLEEILLSRFEQTPGGYRILESNNLYFSRYLSTNFPKIDIAAGYQRVLEIISCNLVRYWVEKTGLSKVVLSGGVTANVKLNQRIFEVEGVDGIFVYPNMGDGGCGTGAAMFKAWPRGVSKAIESVYWGPGFSDCALEKALDVAGLKFSRPASLAADIAARIHSGQVVARFDGRMEYGPRALGNRSILFHAKEPEVNQWLNQRLGRTEFMPFAPVTLFEARNRCYHNINGAERAAEFMTITFDCTEWMKKHCPAAVHVDGTARPQLIRREVNPAYYDIVAEYEKLSGIPCLINTSFNMHEEPIVCSPEDAIRAFLQGNLDVLALGPFLVEHPARSHK